MGTTIEFSAKERAAQFFNGHAWAQHYVKPKQVDNVIHRTFTKADLTAIRSVEERECDPPQPSEPPYTLRLPRKVWIIDKDGHLLCDVGFPGFAPPQLRKWKERLRYRFTRRISRAVHDALYTMAQDVRLQAAHVVVYHDGEFAVYSPESPSTIASLWSEVSVERAQLALRNAAKLPVRKTA